MRACTAQCGLLPKHHVHATVHVGKARFLSLRKLSREGRNEKSVKRGSPHGLIRVRSEECEPGWLAGEVPQGPRPQPVLR